MIISHESYNTIMLFLVSTLRVHLETLKTVKTDEGNRESQRDSSRLKVWTDASSEEVQPRWISPRLGNRKPLTPVSIVRFHIPYLLFNPGLYPKIYYNILTLCNLHVLATCNDVGVTPSSRAKCPIRSLSW